MTCNINGETYREILASPVDRRAGLGSGEGGNGQTR
jgi:hypothetical protein